MGCSILAGACGIGLIAWSLWRIRANRRGGREAVERLLARRGETLVAIQERPIRSLQKTAGLHAFVVFEVVARASDGAERTYEWAYAPPSRSSQATGLQRLAGSIWIAEA